MWTLNKSPTQAVVGGSAGIFHTLLLRDDGTLVEFGEAMRALPEEVRGGGSV